MSYFRQIHTSIWKDEDFLDFTPDEKLLFIYFFSNESTNMSGLYKIPLRVVGFETGLTMDQIQTMLVKFEVLKKIYYRDGWVFVVNFQKYNKGSDKVAVSIQNHIDEIEYCDIKQIYLQYYPQDIPYQYGIDTISEEEYSKEEYSKAKKSIVEEFTAAANLPLPQNPKQAEKHPLINLFSKSVDWMPGKSEWKNVIDTMVLTCKRYEDKQSMADDLKKYSIAWTSRINSSGTHYRISTMPWFYEWFVNGSITDSKQDIPKRSDPDIEWIIDENGTQKAAIKK